MLSHYPCHVWVRQKPMACAELVQISHMRGERLAEQRADLAFMSHGSGSSMPILRVVQSTALA
jgi:hypothetical protein